MYPRLLIWFQETKERVQELRAKASSSRQKADEAKASQAASTTQNKVLEGLTRLKNTGRIDGFHVCANLSGIASI